MPALKYRDPDTGEWVIVPIEGPPGPAGPTGPTGATGPTGSTGPPGVSLDLRAATAPCPSNILRLTPTTSSIVTFHPSAGHFFGSWTDEWVDGYFHFLLLASGGNFQASGSPGGTDQLCMDAPGADWTAGGAGVTYPENPFAGSLATSVGLGKHPIGHVLGPMGECMLFGDFSGGPRVAFSYLSGTTLVPIQYSTPTGSESWTLDFHVHYLKLSGVSGLQPWPSIPFVNFYKVV